MSRFKPLEGTMCAYIGLFPEQGQRECRVATIPRGEEKRSGLPAGDYAFVELYCVDIDCDCERVMINVMYQEEHVATLNWGFNADDDMPGPLLDGLNKQSSSSSALLKLFVYLLQDTRYVERLQRHYHQLKEAVADPAHSIQEKLTPSLNR